MSYADEVLAESPRGFWQFEEASGTAFVDSSGNDYGGTLAGSTATLGVPGIIGNGLQLTGTGRGVVGSMGAAMTSRTAIAAVRIAAFPTGTDPGLFVNGDNALGWYLGVMPSGRFMMRIGATPVGGITGPIYDVDTDLLVVGTYDAPTGTARVFVDGEMVSERTNALDGFPTDHETSLNAVQFGGEPNFGQYPNGIVVDHAAIIDGALSPTRIGELYDAFVAAQTNYDPVTLTRDIVGSTATLTAAEPALEGATHIDYYRRPRPSAVEERGQPFDPTVDTRIARVALPTLTYDDEGLPAGSYEWQAFAVIPEA